MTDFQLTVQSMAVPAAVFDADGGQLAANAPWGATRGEWDYEPAFSDVRVELADSRGAQLVVSQHSEETSVLMAVLQNLPVGVLVESPDRTVDTVNPAFCAMFGITVPPASLTGADCREAAASAAEIMQDPPGFLNRVEQLLQGRTVVRGELVELSDGRVLERDFLPIQDRRGSRILWCYTDVTEKVTADRALAQARDDAIAEAAQRASMASWISHEVRTPLSGMVGLIELLQREELSPPMREIAQSIARSAQSVTELLQDLLDLDRGESVSPPSGSDIFYPTEMAEDVLEIVGRSAQRQGVALSADLDPTVSSALVGDARKVRQIMTNLLSNAVKFTSDGEVSMALTYSGGVFTIRIADTGPGMTDRELETLFRPFAQGEAAKSASGHGVGLGMAITDRLVAGLAGSITVDSAPGMGSTFEVRLPAEPASGHGSGSWEVITSGPLTGRRIAVIGDAPRAVRATAGLLGSAGATVLTGRPSPGVDVLVCYDDATDPTVARRLANLREAWGAASCLLLTRRPAGEDAVAGATTMPLPVRGTVLVGRISGSEGTDGGPEPVDQPFPEGRRVLLAEDDPTNRTLLSAMLGVLGLECDAVPDGRRAVSAVQNLQYDAVLMDVHMPGLDGLDATRQIRAMADSQDLPIIALTASVMAADRQACLDAGMTSYVSKPVSLQGLRAALSEHLQPPAAGSEGPGEPGAGSVDGDRILELTEELGDPDLVRELLQMYLAELGPRLAAIRDAYAAGDTREMITAVHALKSPSGMMGATHLMDLCKAVESALKTGGRPDPSDPATIEAAADATREQLEGVLLNWPPGR